MYYINNICNNEIMCFINNKVFKNLWKYKRNDKKR